MVDTQAQDQGQEEALLREVHFNRIGTTKDVGVPVIRVEMPDAGSWMDVVLDPAEEVVRVAYVESGYEGDMSRMVDEAVRQMGWETVMFLTPMNDTLHEKLHGFREETEYIERIDSTLVYLIGTWNVDS